MATDPATLLATSSCLECYLSEYMLMLLALWKKKLLALNPVAQTDAQALITSAGCYQCFTGEEQMLMQLAMLQQIVAALSPGTDTSPNALLEVSKCYSCNGAGGMWKLFELALLAQIAGP